MYTVHGFALQLIYEKNWLISKYLLEGTCTSKAQLD